MPYQDNVKTIVGKSTKTLGNQLGRWAIHLDFSVNRIAKVTGATRQTVYNWFAGGQVTHAYKERVKTLLRILSTSPSAEVAWKKACSHFDIVA